MPAQKMLRARPQVSYAIKPIPELDSDIEDDVSIRSETSNEPLLDRSSPIEALEDVFEDTEPSEVDDQPGLDSGSEYSGDLTAAAAEEDDVDDSEDEIDDEMLDVGDLDLSDNDKHIHHYDAEKPPKLEIDYAHRCAVCDKPNSTPCTDCEAINYCSEDCQREDWGLHGQICRKMHTLVEAAASNAVRAVLLPVGGRVPEERRKHKYLLVKVKSERVRGRKCEYKHLSTSHADIVDAVEAKGGEVVEAMSFDKHPKSARNLARAMKIYACANYKDTGLTRFLLVMTQRDMAPKEMREIYGDGEFEKHWDPRMYDVDPADISMAVAWLKERYCK